MFTTTYAAPRGLNLHPLTALISGTRRHYSDHFYRYLQQKMSEQQQDQVKRPKKAQHQNKRGHPRDTPEVRVSKSLSYLLRHGAEKAGLKIRQDGYARVSDVLANPMFRDVTFVQLQDIVKRDQKSRYYLMMEPQTEESPGADMWWIRANQGHSMKDVQLELQPILSASDIPMAVHGTTRGAWQNIATQGLSKMTRNHIHLALDVPGSNVISGMRNSSQILVFVDVQKALDAGIKFYLSANGVVLTEGNSTGFLPPEFFKRVENANRIPVEGWEGSGPITPVTIVPPESNSGDGAAVQGGAETASPSKREAQG